MVTRGKPFPEYSDAAPADTFGAGDKLLGNDASGELASYTLEALQTALDGRFVTADSPRTVTSAGIPAVMASPPTQTTHGPGGASPIASAVTFLYNTAPVTKYGANYTLINQFSQDYWSSVSSGVWGAAPWWIEFDYTGQDFAIRYRDRAGGTNASFWVWVDGVPATAASFHATAGSGGSLFRHRINFGSVATRRIKVLLGLADFGGVEIGPSDTMVAVPNTRTRLQVVGDSYVEGALGVEPSDLFASRLSSLLNLEVFLEGQGGTGYVATGGGGTKSIYGSAGRLGVTNTFDPDLVMFFGSINDDASHASVAAAAAACYAALSPRPLIVIGPPSPGPPTANRWRNANAVASSALAAPNVIAFVDPLNEGWLTGTGRSGAATNDGNRDVYTGTDSTHLTTAGHQYFADRLARTLSAVLPASFA
jgi:lysophospholipase L1-like esterase